MLVGVGVSPQAAVLLLGGGGTPTPSPAVNTVAPTISGTGTVGQTLTRTAGTWTGADSVSGEWRRDSVGIGSTASTYVLQAADAGTFVDYYETAVKAGATDAHQGSNGIAVAASATTDGTYDGKNNTASTVAGVAAGGTFPDGTLLTTAYPDLTASAEASTMTVNDSAKLQFITSDGVTLTKTAGGADFTTQCTYTPGFSPPRFAWDVVDANNYRYLNLGNGDNGYTPHTVSGGVDTAGTFVSFGANVAAGDTIAIIRSGSTMTLKRNGVLVGSGWAAARVNDVVGWKARGGGARWDDWILSSVSNPISISSVEVDDDGYYQVAGAYSTPTPTTIEIRRFTSDGDLAADWETCTGTISGGSFAVTSATIASAAVQGGNARVQIRASNNTGVERSVLVAVPYFRAIPAFVNGMNMPNFGLAAGTNTTRDLLLEAKYEGSAASAIYDHNYIQKEQIATGDQIPDTESGIGYDGTIQSYGTGYDRIRVTPKTKIPATGSYTLTFPAAMSVAVTLTGHGSVTASSAGSRTITFTDSTWPANEVAFEFSGGTNGSLNFRPTMTQNADANPSRLQGEGLVSMLSSLGNPAQRYMDPSDVVSDPITRTGGTGQLWTGPVTMGPVRTEIMTGIVTATEPVEAQAHFSHQWDDATTTAVLAKWLTQIPTDTVLAVAYSNEVWNPQNGQGRHFHEVGLRGMRLGKTNAAGDEDAAGDGSPLTIRTDGINDVYLGSTTDGHLTATFTTGELVYANYTGYKVFRALKNNAIGGTDYLGNASAWEVYYNDEASDLARRRQYADECQNLFDLADAAAIAAGFDPRTKIKRVVEWQPTGQSRVQAIFTWNDLALNYDRLMIAPYAGGGLGGHNIGDYSVDMPGWGATEKNLVSTNVTAFKTAFFAYFNTVIDGAVQTAREFAQDHARWLVDEYGLGIDDREFGSYEYQWHWITQSNWGANQTAINTEWRNLLTDARMATALTRHMTGLATYVGGLHYFYVLTQGALASAGEQYFGIIQSEADIGNARAVAYAVLS